MTEHSYCTAVAPELQLISKQPPNPGQHILALTIGERLIEVLWNASLAKHYVAWMPYPKLSAEVKQACYQAYLNGVK